MTRTLRFHFDEHLSAAVAEGLRRSGIDITMPQDFGLLSASDDRHLEFCRSQQRVIVTHDVDFVRLHAMGIKHAGVIYCHQSKYGTGELISLLTLAWEILDSSGMNDRLEYL